MVTTFTAWTMISVANTTKCIKEKSFSRCF